MTNIKICEKCGGILHVADSRPFNDNTIIIRRRKCNNCGFTLYTKETAVKLTDGRQMMNAAYDELE
jgi:transcriptional regulator NrdR family protein